MRRNSISITMLDIGKARRGPGNTGAARSGLPSRIRANGRTVPITASEASESGTRCSRPAFMRPAGTVQTLASRSISPHRAPKTSPVRAAVKIANSSARAAMPSRPRRASRNSGKSSIGRAAWCSTLRTFAAGRQDLGEVAFPLRRVRPLPEASHRGGVKHRLDAAADPARGFRLLGPDRIEHLNDQPGIDRRGGQFPQSGVNIGFERRGPLRRMLRVAPACPVLFDEFDGALAEGSALRDGNALRLPLRRPCVERVDALVSLLPMLRRFRACLGERDIGEGSESHVAPLAVELKPENPGFRPRNFDATDVARCRDAEVKPTAIV